MKLHFKCLLSVFVDRLLFVVAVETHTAIALTATMTSTKDTSLKYCFSMILLTNALFFRNKRKSLFSLYACAWFQFFKERNRLQCPSPTVWRSWSVAFHQDIKKYVLFIDMWDLLFLSVIVWTKLFWHSFGFQIKKEWINKLNNLLIYKNIFSFEHLMLSLFT